MGTTRESEALDALRRRLYAPGATAAEVDAYRAAAERQAEADAPVQEHRVQHRGTGAPARALAAGAALLLAGGVAVLVTTHPLARLEAGGTAARTSASPSPSSVEGEVPASVEARAEFVAALRSGREAGLLEYLYEHRTYLPPEISTPRRLDSTEYAGEGSSTIALDPTDLAQHGGRVTVILVLDRGADYSWFAQRVAQRNDRSGPVLEVAEQAGRNRAGEPSTTTFRYDGRAPTALAVQLDEAVRWGAVVVFTD